MKTPIFKGWLLILFIVTFSFSGFTQSVEYSPTVLKDYLEAVSVTEKMKHMKNIIRSGLDFDSVYAGLKKGKSYSNLEERGFIETYLPDSRGKQHYFLVYIPTNYDASKKTAVKIWLHGAVYGFVETNIINTWIPRDPELYKNVNYILVYPAGWLCAPWCSDIQTKNLSNLIGWLKQSYNIDENRISLCGCSDGGIGTFYMSNTIPTNFSSFTSLVGNPSSLGIFQKEFYPSNLKNRPLYVINGRKDDVFPAESVEAYMDLWKKNGVRSQYIMVDTMGHECYFPGKIKANADAFIVENPRNPYPDSLWWMSENDSIYNRFHWYVMDRIGKTKTDTIFSETNSVIIHDKNTIAYKREKPRGGADIVKSGNTVHVKTSGVKKYTLLLSPDHFDFSQPITIYTNGVLSYQGNVRKSLKTLLKWNILDNDRTMLFGAEIHIRVGKITKEN